MASPTLDLTSLQAAVASLEAAVAAYEGAAPGSSTNEVSRVLLAGTIKNFEFVYELALRMLRRRLEWEGELPLPIDQMVFRDVIRVAGERGLIEDVEAWFRYRLLRNITAHTYEERRALEAYAKIPEFLGDAKSLLANLELRHD